MLYGKKPDPEADLQRVRQEIEDLVTRSNLPSDPSADEKQSEIDLTVEVNTFLNTSKWVSFFCILTYFYVNRRLWKIFTETPLVIFCNNFSL